MNKKQYFLVAVLGLLITTALTSVAVQAAGRGMGSPRNTVSDDNRPQVQQAIVDNNYNTWATAMTTQVADMRQRASDMEAKINQDTFDKLVQAHQLMQDGKRDEAKAIFDELGMFGPMGHMGGRGMGRPADAPLNGFQTTE